MKKLLMTVMALSCFAFSSYGQKKWRNKLLVNGATLIPMNQQANSRGLSLKKVENALPSTYRL